MCVRQKVSFFTLRFVRSLLKYRQANYAGSPNNQSF